MKSLLTFLFVFCLVGTIAANANAQYVYPPIGEPVYQHLQGPPHYHTPAELAGMSYHEMLALHTAEHGGDPIVSDAPRFGIFPASNYVVRRRPLLRLFSRPLFRPRAYRLGWRIRAFFRRW